MKKFQNELKRLINSHSIDNECDVPDFLLAEMIVNFIRCIRTPIKKTLDWHGVKKIDTVFQNEKREKTFLEELGELDVKNTYFGLTKKEEERYKYMCKLIER